MMKKGFTLTELVIGMLISSILILTIGVMSGVGTSSYGKLRTEADVYNELYSGVSFIEHSVRSAQGISFTNNSLIATGLIEIDPPNRTYDCTITVSSLGNSMYDLIYNDTLSHTATIMKNVENLSIQEEPDSDAANGFFSARITGIKDNVSLALPLKVFRRNA